MDAKELGAQGASVREKKRIKSKVPNQRSTRGFKGDKPDLHLRRRARRVSKTFVHARACPRETTARKCDASVPAGCGLAEPARGHDGAVTSITSAKMPAPITAPTSPLRL
jgi:hypothetical protein